MAGFAIIEAPFHLGREGDAVGRGPRVLIDAGVAQIFAGEGGAPCVVHVRRRTSAEAEFDAVVDVNREIAAAVREAAKEGSLPVVLAGNCNACLGVLAGLDARRIGVVWLDAHSDFNTPETSVSGSLDGMALAAVVGDCHRKLAAEIGLERPVREEHVLLLAVRDLDELEHARLGASRITTRWASNLGDLRWLLSDLRDCVDAVYLHVDIDFLAAEESPGVNYRGPGGVPVGKAEELIARIAITLPLAAVAFTNYNPDHDPEGRSIQSVQQLMAALRGGTAS